MGTKVSQIAGQLEPGPMQSRKKRHTEAEIATKLAEAHTLAAGGLTQGAVAKALGISVMTFHRWRKAHTDLQTSAHGKSQTASLIPVALPPGKDRGNRYAELQLENLRLRKLVTDLLLEKMKLEEEWGQNLHGSVKNIT
jgi:putative transposase